MKLFGRVLGLLAPIKRFVPPVDCVYPNGSVPLNFSRDEPEEVRVARWKCAENNHHPRECNGSWSMAYGYACYRCGMWADPFSKEHKQAMCDAVNRLEAEVEDFYLGDLVKAGRP